MSNQSLYILPKNYPSDRQIEIEVNNIAHAINIVAAIGVDMLDDASVSTFMEGVGDGNPYRLDVDFADIKREVAVRESPTVPNVGQVLDAVRLKQIDEINKPVELPTEYPANLLPLEGDGWDACLNEIRKMGPLYASPFGLAQKYDDVLLPFIGMMRHELHANSQKGDRRAWLCMGHNQSILEAYHHVAKLANAVRDGNLAGIREHTADVANIAMMIADIHGAWNCESEQAEHEAQALGLRS